LTTYCAFLRGVNVNGKAMKMAEAGEALVRAGLTGVVPVLASGNIIFRSDMAQGGLRGFLENVLSDRFGDDVRLFVKTSEEVSAMLASSPFEDDPEFHTYVFVCEPGSEDGLLAEFDRITPSEGEAAEVAGGLFYWRCRKGATLDSGFSKILGRKDMRGRFTSRNIGTIAKVAAKMEA